MNAELLTLACNDVGLDVERRQLMALAARIAELSSEDDSCCVDGWWHFEFVDSDRVTFAAERCYVCAEVAA